MEKKKIRVRFAPSPTGGLHIGGLRTALFNYLYASKYKGDFILRIDNTDKKRNIKKSIQYILKSLDWCKIKYNEGYNKKSSKYGPYIQSKRINIYKKYIKKLIKNKLAYYAFDSKKDLKLYKKNPNFIYNSLTRKNLKNSLNFNKKKINYYKKKKNYVIRIKTPSKTNITFIDKIYGKIKINSRNIDDKILFKSNNIPTYHFATVIDDHLMKISHIIRGKEWLTSTSIHILLYKFFNWKIPQYIHLPLILNYNNKGKISKRNPDNELPIYPIKSDYKLIKIKNSYQEKGFYPEVFFYILASLGWSPKLKEYSNKFLEKKKIIKLFKLNNLNKSNIHLNYKKFCWINKQYINNKKYKKKVNIKLLNFLKKKLKNLKIKINKKKLKKIINLTKNRIYLINDIWDVTYYFFIDPKNFNIIDKIKTQLLNKYIIKKIKLFFKKIKLFFKKKYKKNNIYILNKLIKKIKNNYSILFLKLLRLSIVGELTGIDIVNILFLIKKKIIIKRINFFLKQIIYQYKI
ncbi:MAG: glutamate--tRNA ligase [Candidatus Shikimatogenerans sp. JK-2022]|nr:glutamate--tRNA ligase [Candidatus Shikimatogenerans bostrichidophilus]